MPQRRADIERFFHPNGVVVIGEIDPAESEEELRDAHDRCFGEGNWQLVHPEGGAVGLTPVHKSLADVPGPLDLAVISAPARLCPRLVDECGVRGVRFALVLTNGFAEAGDQGLEFERQLAAAGRMNGIRILGPCADMNPFEPVTPGGGSVALVTQSGEAARSVAQASHLGVGFSRAVAVGNEVDLELADFIEYFAGDQATAVIAGYVEGINDGVKLRRALGVANATRTPVVLLKIGATEAGSRAAKRATGADAVFDGLASQHGVVRVGDLDELAEAAALFARLRGGTRLRPGLLAVGAGPAALMAEQAACAGLQPAALAPATRSALLEHLPADARLANPIALDGTFLASQPPHVRRTLVRTVLDDPTVDVLLVAVTGADPPATELFGDDIAALSAETDTPILVSWGSSWVDDAGVARVLAAGLPVFRSLAGCCRALRRFNDYQEAALHFRPRRPPVGAAASLADLPLARAEVVTSVTGAVRAARDIGLPVMLKGADGATRTGVASVAAVRSAYTELSYTTDGPMTVQAMPPADGVEMVLAVIRDAVLGPALMLGMGGPLAELIDDFAVRPLPLDRQDARDMVRALRGYPVLDGADVAALVGVIETTASLVAEYGDRLVELELDPIVVRTRGDGAVVVDHLLVLE